jgi:hypothetical protein
MWIIETLMFLAILVFASAILAAIKKGFSEVVGALQAIHDLQSKRSDK